MHDRVNRIRFNTLGNKVCLKIKQVYLVIHRVQESKAFKGIVFRYQIIICSPL